MARAATTAGPATIAGGFDAAVRPTTDGTPPPLLCPLIKVSWLTIYGCGDTLPVCRHMSPVVAADDANTGLGLTDLEVSGVSTSATGDSVPEEDGVGKGLRVRVIGRMKQSSASSSGRGGGLNGGGGGMGVAAAAAAAVSRCGCRLTARRLPADRPLVVPRDLCIVLSTPPPQVGVGCARFQKCIIRHNTRPPLLLCRSTRPPAEEKKQQAGECLRAAQKSVCVCVFPHTRDSSDLSMPGCC